MLSEWAKSKAEKILKPEGCLHDDSCEGPYGEEPCDCWVAEVRQEITAALDEARDEGRKEALGDAVPLKDLMAEALAEARREGLGEGRATADQELYKRGLLVGAERERWACKREVRDTLNDLKEQGSTSAGLEGLRWAESRIAARGPMRGPEEE